MKTRIQPSPHALEQGESLPGYKGGPHDPAAETVLDGDRGWDGFLPKQASQGIDTGPAKPGSLYMPLNPRKS